MSPRYDKWRSVPSGLQEQIKNSLPQELSLATLINKGFAFIFTGGRISKLRNLSELTDGQLADARKQTSSWHVVSGLERSHHRPRRETLAQSDILPEKRSGRVSKKPRRYWRNQRSG